MTADITQWLRTESLPRNVYELLGRPPLDPDRDAMLAALRAANRELLDYQGHSESSVADRALVLLEELGKARAVLEDPAKLTAHNERVLHGLREHYSEGRGANALHD